jgi:hypothetical protein
MTTHRTCRKLVGMTAAALVATILLFASPAHAVEPAGMVPAQAPVAETEQPFALPGLFQAAGLVMMLAGAATVASTVRIRLPERKLAYSASHAMPAGVQVSGA